MAVACGVKNAGNRFLEFRHHLVRDGFLIDAFVLGDRAFQRAALIHRRRGDHAARIRNGFESLAFSWSEFHPAFLRS